MEREPGMHVSIGDGQRWGKREGHASEQGRSWRGSQASLQAEVGQRWSLFTTH